MSSDSSSIASIRHEQALPMLIHLLKVLPRVLLTSEFHIMLCPLPLPLVHVGVT